MLRLVLAGALALFCSVGRADIIWSYSSTNGTTTVSGMLTTFGNPGDELVSGMVFNLKSIDSIYLNESLITAWVGPVSPPFSRAVSGSVITQGTSGSALVHQTLHAEGMPPAGQLVEDVVTIGKPLDITMAGWQSYQPYIPHFHFSPTVTTLQSVPEPSSVGLLALTAGLLARRRRH